MNDIKVAKKLVEIAKILIAGKQTSESSQRNRRKRNRLDITYREIGLLDNPWREIFLRWFDGKGDWENAPFGDYLMKNNSLRREIAVKLLPIISNFLKSTKSNQKIETSFHIELDDNGYTTGYELLHGTTKYKGVSNNKQDFELNLELKKQITDDRTVIIGKAHCVWHDIIDANRKYWGEGEVADTIKKYSNAKDYKIEIPFDFQFKIEQNHNKKWTRKGYPWENK